MAKSGFKSIESSNYSNKYKKGEESPQLGLLHVALFSASSKANVGKVKKVGMMRY